MEMHQTPVRGVTMTMKHCSRHNKQTLFVFLQKLVYMCCVWSRECWCSPGKEDPRWEEKKIRLGMRVFITLITHQQQKCSVTVYLIRTLSLVWQNNWNHYTSPSLVPTSNTTTNTSSLQLSCPCVFSLWGCELLWVISELLLTSHSGHQIWPITPHTNPDLNPCPPSQTLSSLPSFSTAMPEGSAKSSCPGVMD